MKRKVFLKTAALCCWALALVFAVGCGQSNPAEKAAPAQPEPMTIHFASDCTWPPMEFLDSDKQIVGFTSDLVHAMAELGTFKAKITNVAWDNIFPGLAAGQYDVVSSSVTITEERKVTMDFSDPYFEVKQACLVQKGSPIAVEADLKGKKIGAQIGTTGHFAAQRVEAAEPKSYDEIGLAVEDLYNGALDAVICDNPVAANFALQNEKYKNSLELVFLLASDKAEYLGWAVKKGDAKGILPVLNDALAKVKASGKYDEIYAKNFGK